MPESADEGFIFASGKSSSGSFEALGDRIWFGTSKSRVFYSYDRGKTWSASAPILPGRPIDNVAFRDSLNGIAISAVNDMINTAPKLAFHTADGGQTWTPLPGANTTWGGWLTDVEYVPGSGGVYWGISQTRTVLSKDNGNTWVQEDTPFLLWFAEFLSPNVGWGGGAVHPTPPTSKLLMYKWIGDSLVRDERINTTKTMAGSGIEGHLDGAVGTARFWNPKGMAIDHAGNVYVADDYNHCIRKITPLGQISTLAGTGQPGYADGPGASAQFNRPQDVALDADGNLYVADAGNYLIRKIAPNATVSLLAGQPGMSGTTDGPALQATFNWLSGLAIDPAGNLIAGSGAAIRKITPSGQVSTLQMAAGPVGGLDVDRYGTIYFTDYATFSVYKLTPGGQLSTLAGGTHGCADGIGAAAQFGSIDDLDADDFGRVYVADGANARIRRIDPDGTVISLVGADCLNGYGLDQQPVDGPVNLVQLGRLRGILLKPSESLLLTAWDDDMVREVRLGAPLISSGIVLEAGSGTHYNSMLATQASPLSFSSTVMNTGDQQLPVRLGGTVLRDGVSVYQNTGTFKIIPAGGQVQLDLGNEVLFSTPGNYQVQLSILSTGSGVVGTWSEVFSVSDSVLAADDGHVFFYDNIEQVLPDGAADYGQVYEIPLADTLTGFFINAELQGAPFYFSVYALENGAPGSLVYTSDTVLGVFNDYPYDYYHRLPQSLALPAGAYLFALHQWTSAGALGLGLDTDRNDQSAWYRSADQNIPDWTPLYQFWGEQTAPVYMLRPVFGAPALTISDAKEEPAQMLLQVHIAPNPVSDWLYVKVQANWSEQFILQLTDATGRLLLESVAQGGAITAVDLSQLSAGMYGLRLINGARVGFSKIIKR
ncbi:MAG: T9SS type A sorting domain-containing protein [Saprospiraceae bacterium]|nr:T9SS type A sorting domain-containing protein [Saprospiraceae bacterium]